MDTSMGGRSTRDLFHHGIMTIVSGTCIVCIISLVILTGSRKSVLNELLFVKVNAALSILLIEVTITVIEKSIQAT